MIRRSWAIATLAILLSLGAHVMGLSVAAPGPPSGADGDAATDVVALGTAFEDMAETVSEPVPPEAARVPEPPVETPPEPEQAEVPTSKALVASADPQPVAAPDTGSARVPRPGTTGTAGAGSGRIPEPETIEPTGVKDRPITSDTAQPMAEPAAAAVAPEGSPDGGAAPEGDPVPGPAAVAAAVPPPLPPLAPAFPLAEDVVEPSAPETQVVSVPEAPTNEDVSDEAGGSELAVAVSARPRARDPRPSAKPLGLVGGSIDYSALQVPPSQLIESPLVTYQRYRSQQSSQSGGVARSSGRGFVDARGPGNSDVTNYVGRVLVHLNRAPAVHVSGFGTARVFFEINPDGSLAWVDIIDSTGSREVERAAKAQVRRAAPFPRPPQGTSRRLTFVYRVN